VILVTLGTHLQPMDRLIEAIDDLIANGTIRDEVVIQAAAFRSLPAHAAIRAVVSHDELQALIAAADVIVAHAGPGTLGDIRSTGRSVVVVPRQPPDEHVDDHQVRYATRLAGTPGYHVVLDLEDLAEAVDRARERSREATPPAVGRAVEALEELLHGDGGSVVGSEPYDPQAYWTDVAASIAQRGGADATAGDDTPFYRYKRDRFVERFLRTLPVASRRVLEVGCGPGGNLAVLAALAPSRLAGCDISPGMAELARERVGAAADIHITDGATLPFADREFDLVFTTTVLQHNPDETVTQLLHEMCRVAGEDLYIIEDTAPVRRERPSLWLRTVREYADLAAVEGFGTKRVDPLGIDLSNRLARIMRAVLNRPGRREGEPVSPVHRAVEGAVLPLLRRLDGWFGQRSGLVRMHFRRTSSGQGAVEPTPASS
jgi:UDP-N-acetylglucosamine transferase subunit ALG13/SAM-dependent methyltransferase